ncbi:DNA processing protein DprA [Paenibacillus baekrokdamisoli]|uniref:DNA processing protein DprA n=1 Tax=Paenibacillus baekrokdamisoli TaxID=1712516 RepID=A0A3G9IR66_9BACL|nr:DNA-processing protein DprA [Paenibacillus baekrokdamisoli]MBB3069760.1 DNA processing protein [Paenibacillus baekrokdamisoli]BBH20886.1 DNA processing protein DprA [Paenibacillus baekrokdamisoli]
MINETVRKEMIITLHETSGVGWQAIRKVVDHGAWKSYDRYTAEAWTSSVGLRLEQAKAISTAFSQQDIAKRNESMLQKGITIITPFDEAYPELLKQSATPPWVLYAIGRIELLSQPCIAIVGTRSPTAYGRRTASDLAESLSTSGLTVVSGLARGVDGMAHEGALRGSGSTIAVLGTPVDTIYPLENRGLYQEIAKHGLILSEVPLGTPIHPGLFPQRNRIIAGLSLGTVVVEAAQRSGSLITADQALDMSRDVFAVPGPISSPKSTGTNDLIRQGAKLISSAQDILEEYSSRLPIQRTKSELGTQSVSSNEDILTKDEAIIYQILQDAPRSTDELHELSEYPFGLLHAILINLTIKRKIEQHPGSIYSAR